MSLSYKYYESGAYIRDLQKLKFYNMEYTVYLLFDKLRKKNKKNFKKLCYEAINILNNIRIILRGYITEYQKNEAFEDTIYKLDKLKYYFNLIKHQNEINFKIINKLEKYTVKFEKSLASATK